MKKVLLITVLALALVFAFSATAMASYGPHGGYSSDTDACAGCHRAHTSFSSATWTDYQGNAGRSALLVGNANTMTDFCYACHGDAAQGASTNVASGMFDGSVTGTSTVGGSVLYPSGSTMNAPLQGGGFKTYTPYGSTEATAVTSIHTMEATNAPLWGYGNAMAEMNGTFTCTSCHDPHGSSNYRLLRDELNNVDLRNNVLSNEAGLGGAGFAGFKKGEDGAAQMNTYRPNYTVGAASAEGYMITPIRAGSSAKSLSTWCAGCHTAYAQRNDEFSSTPGSTGTYSYAGFTGGAEGMDSPQNYHRHPVNAPMSVGLGTENVFSTELLADSVLPLEQSFSGHAAETFATGNIGCLTCHYAHGTTAKMEGWAQGSTTVLATGVVQLDGTSPLYVPAYTGGVGVAPNNGVTAEDGSALLRADNRGVCERCHNK